MTGPWIALIVSLGVLAVAIVVVALVGAGVGPEPTLRRPEEGEEARDHDAPDVTSPGAS